jgi:hypothetical protein
MSNSCLGFALLINYVQLVLLFLPVTPSVITSGKSRILTVGPRIGRPRRRRPLLRDGILGQGFALVSLRVCFRAIFV